MKTLTLAIALMLSLGVKAQECKLVKAETEHLIKFSINSPKKQKSIVSIINSMGKVLWSKKVKIPKGVSEPKLYFKPATPGMYVIKIGDFFTKNMEL